MKKAISLLLVLNLCFSLCACGNGAQNNKTQTGQDNEAHNETLTEVAETKGNELILCQEWKSIANGEVISFDEDGNFYINGQIFLYEYDKDASKILVDAGVQVSLPVSLVDGIYRIDVEGEEFAPAGEYEKLHAEYSKAMMVVPGFEGTPALNAALVAEHISRVELTVDNWRDYIKEYTYDVEIVEKDAFDEITNRETVTVYRLGYGTEKYYCLSATIELKHKETGEILLLGGSLASNLAEDIEAVRLEPFNLDAYECTRIKGYMYFVDYPEEVFEEVLNVYDRQYYERANASITVTSSFMEGNWSVDCEAMVIESNSDNWADYFE